MKGAHDLGGRSGLGPINPNPNEPVFHHEWEKRAFAMTVACGFLGKWNLDMSRYARETMPDPEYLASSYYEKWIFGLQELLVDKGLLTEDEIHQRMLELSTDDSK